MNITITQPDDWHLHVRTGAMLHTVINDTARIFARAIIMPNLTPAVTSVPRAIAYREEILAACQYPDFQPLMTLYLTGSTTRDDVLAAAVHPDVHAIKLYPAGATTNSSQGISQLEGIYPLLEVMSEQQLPLLIHGEVTDANVDIFDREKAFIDRYLEPITRRFPELKIVLEHITTQDAVQFVMAQNDNLAATLTAHHLLFNRNDMLAGGIRPHFYCLPILKRQRHQQSLLQAATSGSPKFFLGSDSAPHAQQHKETACGCAGCYTAINAISLYAEAFAQADALPRLEAFASHFGADFYGLPRNTGKIQLSLNDWTVPDSLAAGDERLIPFLAGQALRWQATPV